MSLDFLTDILNWLAAHRGWTGTIVFLVAFGESLAIVGLIVPGAVLMFGFGALVATGHLDFWTTMAWAAAGAIAGDGLSYWLGHHYREQLARVWPLSRHPGLLERGIAFFNRHGSKSVVLGRFVGPLRAVIPAVAGMLHMPVARFAAANVFSGLTWAPLYLLPGIAFGLSLQLATEVAGRLAVLLLGLLTFVFALAWLAGRIYRFILPRVDRLITGVLRWSERHPRIGKLPAALVDPDHPEARAVSLLALLLLGAMAGLALLVPAILSHTPLENLDRLVFHALQSLRTPFGDRLMVGLTSPGDPAALAVVTAAVAAWYAMQRRRKAVLHLLAAYAVPLLVVYLLPLLIEVEPPLRFGANVDNHSIPAAHAALATAVYGFLAVLMARESPARYRIVFYTGAVVLAGSIALSRLYLGTHWLSAVLGGMLLGLAWVALLGIGYRRHTVNIAQQPANVAITALILLATASVDAAIRHPQQLLAYVPAAEPRIVTRADWEEVFWQTLPSFREDLRDRHTQPMTLQWAGDPTQVRHTLEEAGWRAPVTVDAASVMQWLNPRPSVDALPVLPQVHAGRYETLRLVKPNADNQLLVVRLWDAGVQIDTADGQVPLWHGTVGRLEMTRTAGIAMLRTRDDFDVPLHRLLEDLAGSDAPQPKLLRRGADAAKNGIEVVLLFSRAPGAALRPTSALPLAACATGARDARADHPCAGTSASAPAPLATAPPDAPLPSRHRHSASAWSYRGARAG
ncbi:MAG: VTT domain-containing protein [Pseudomonadota bacterium]|nr:MAG: VTT domain-containing protein [Pseudomonadota bacterium]